MKEFEEKTHVQLCLIFALVCVAEELGNSQFMNWEKVAAWVMVQVIPTSHWASMLYPHKVKGVRCEFDRKARFVMEYIIECVNEFHEYKIFKFLQPSPSQIRWNKLWRHELWGITAYWSDTREETCNGLSNMMKATPKTQCLRIHIVYWLRTLPCIWRFWVQISGVALREKFSSISDQLIHVFPKEMM